MPVTETPITLDVVRTAVLEILQDNEPLAFEDLWLALLPRVETARAADFWRYAIDKLAQDQDGFTIVDDQVRRASE